MREHLSQMEDPRRFTDWDEDGLRAALGSAGWADIEVVRFIRGDEPRLSVIARKP